MNVYQLEDGETHWYVAKSEYDALRIHLQYLFIEPLPEDLTTISCEVEKEIGIKVEEIEVVQCNPNQFIKIFDYDGDGTTEDKTAAEWVADYQGEGYLLCSTVY